MRTTKSLRWEKEHTSVLIHAFFILWALICIVPMLICVSASFSSERDLAFNGFGLFPEKIDLTAYKYLFANPEIIFRAYGSTIFITVAGTSLAVMLETTTAYALARANFIWKNKITAFLFFPTLFGGGMVASYIINTQVLHLADTWTIMIVGPGAFFYIVMFRTFFKQLPEGLFDAAKIDGANEFRIYGTIAMRLSTPVIASVAFLTAMSKWNVWHVCQLYIRDEKKYTLQYLLQRMLMSIDSLLMQMEKAPSTVTMADLPGENLRMALMVVCIGPMMMVFPFFQKYFAKGMTVGAVKG